MLLCHAEDLDVELILLDGFGEMDRYSVMMYQTS